MEQGPIQTLEAAAQVLLAPPNVVTPEQRHQAESVFHEFRSTKNPYQLCREILEKPSVDYVLFEAAGLLKTALIREWSMLSENDISSLRQYLLNYLLEKEVPGFLKEKILQTISIIIKRASIDDGGEERRALLTELESIILNSNLRQQKLACSLILSIMQEYAITVKSADVGLIWEVHFLAKKQFEAVDLKRIFRFIVGVLAQLVRSGHRGEGEQAVLTKQLLTIVETILCWAQVSPLLPKRLIGAFELVYESDSAPALRLNSNWKDTILQPELLGLFFDLHMHVRSDPELANPSLMCLVQLASLSGFVVSNKTVKQQYLENYVNRFLNMLNSLQPMGREMLGIADMYRKLVQFFTPSMIATMPAPLFQHLTSLTCHCIRGAIVEEGTSDDTIWRESLNRFLDTWSSLVHDGEFPNETLQGPSIEIFNTYLQCRLAPPDGTRGTESNDGCGDDIKDDIEEDERKQHSVVLATIGAIARMAPAHCCHVLYTLLHDRSQKLETQLQMLHMGKLQVSGGEQLVSLFEDMHWILMIAGHFLAMDCTEGETVMMPPEIIEYSIAENSADVDASLRYMVGESTSTLNVHPIIKLVGEILRISAYEGAALNAGLGSVFSPELSATLSWLLKIWANSYLMPVRSHYSQMSGVLECAWGAASSGAGWVVSRLVSRVSACLRHLHAQPAAAQQALQLLLTLAYIRDKQGRLASCEELLALVAWEAGGNNLAGHLRRDLHKAFAVAATYAEGEARNRLLSSTVALQEKLVNIINTDSDTEPVRSLLADTLDCYIGIADGVHEVGMMDEQFIMLSGALEKIPGILFRYHNYPGVVLPCLNLLSRSAKRMLHSLDSNNATRFYEVCNASFEVYGRWNSGRIASLPQDAEEDSYQVADEVKLVAAKCPYEKDICVLMELISCVGRCVDFGASARDEGAASVCARGLRLVLPLITPQLLMLPALAHSAYRMLRDLDNAEQICALPIEDFNTVISALHVGLKAVSADVSTLCCDTIVGLSSRVRTLGEDSPYAQSLLTLAELLLSLIIKMDLSQDSIPAAGSAIYALTCVKPALLENLARQLIEALSRNDPVNVPRLERAFAELTTGVLFDGQRQHKLKFRENFDKFLVNVQGFLIVK